MIFFRKSALPVILLALAGCATQGKPPPTISLDEPVQAQPLPEPPAPVEVVAVPEVLPMPAQLKPLPEAEDAKPTPEPADETVRVSRANAEARVAPTREGYVNAIQVWPFTDGALYQVYAAVGRVTRFAPAGRGTGDGGRRRYRALDRGRHVQRQRCRSARERAGQADSLGLKTNLVITTSRRTYLLELASTEKTWMASVSWSTRATGCWPCSARHRPLAPLRRWTPACRWRTCASLRDQRQQSAVEAVARLRRRAEGHISSPPASRKASCRRFCHRCAGRWATGELPLPLAVLHRGSAVRRGRTALGR